jgi:hypothetical protein
MGLLLPFKYSALVALLSLKFLKGGSDEIYRLAQFHLTKEYFHSFQVKLFFVMGIY